MDLDTINNELLSIADSGLKYAKNKLPDSEIELYVSQNNTITIDINGGTVIARDSLYSGLAIRIFNNKKKSFACSSGIGIDNMKDAINEAITISNKISFIDERFNSLYSPNGAKKSNEGIVDHEITNLNYKLLGDQATKLVEDSKIDEKIVSLSGSREASYGAYAVVNSNGINSATRYTVNIAVIEALAKEGSKQKGSFNFAITRNVKDFDLAGVGEKASKEALSLLNSKPLKKAEQLPTVWDDISASLYFKTAIEAPISGKSVIEGDSYFADKIGDVIAAKNLSIIDDGQLPEAITTFSIDGEGVPSQKTNLIDKGMLKSFVTDSYYSHLLETPSTGNAKRQSNPGYEGIPEIATNTLNVTPGIKSKDELISEIDLGVYVTGFLLGIGHTNPVTGNMSAVSPSAYLIEKGEIKHSLDAVSIAGNIYKSLLNIRSIGSEVILTPFGVKTAPIVIDGFTVTG